MTSMNERKAMQSFEANFGYQGNFGIVECPYNDEHEAFIPDTDDDAILAETAFCPECDVLFFVCGICGAYHHSSEDCPSTLSPESRKELEKLVGFKHPIGGEMKMNPKARKYFKEEWSYLGDLEKTYCQEGHQAYIPDTDDDIINEICYCPTCDVAVYLCCLCDHFGHSSENCPSLLSEESRNELEKLVGFKHPMN